MFHRYFPPCPVDGPIDPPSPFGHLGLVGTVPNKCADCRHLFEGECTRFVEEVGCLLHLDHGPCGVDGPTDPVLYEDAFISAKVAVPRKCVSCVHLKVDNVHGFHCLKDADKWGHFHRGLDWGSWRPDHVYLQLDPPKVTTKALSDHAFTGNQLAFIKEHRRINPGLSIREAKVDYEHFRRVIEQIDPR